jgi:hypothetical protein
VKSLDVLLDDAIQRLFAPQPIVRLAVLRIGIAVALLVFVATRVIYPDDWLSSDGFRIPPLDGDYHQVVYLSPLSPFTARVFCALVVVAGLATAAGFYTRWSAALLAVLLGYAAISDRGAAFTVLKIGPVLLVALALSPAGEVWSVDAWRRKRRDASYVPPALVSGGCVRFFQIFLAVFYLASGIAKARGDWVHNPYVLWSHLHDSYQTPVSWFFANHLPSFAWSVMQYSTLAFELGAPLWFVLPWTRTVAAAYGVAMHALIGMMFGPLAGFSLLMMTLLVGSFAPATLLDPKIGARSPSRKQPARRPPAPHE